MEKMVLLIDQQLSSIGEKIVSENMQKMKCVAETIMFVADRALPFMGTMTIENM